MNWPYLRSGYVLRNRVSFRLPAGPEFRSLFRSYYLLPRVRKNTMSPADRKITSFLTVAPVQPHPVPSESDPSRSTKWVTMVFNTSSCGIIHARDRPRVLRGIRVADIDTGWRKYRLAANSLGSTVKDLHELYYAILLLQPWMWVFRTSSVALRIEWIFIPQCGRVIWTMDEQSRSHSVVTTWIGSRDMISKPKLIVLESTTS